MAVRVVEVTPPTTIQLVDFATSFAVIVRIEFDAGTLNAGESDVELRVTHQEGALLVADIRGFSVVDCYPLLQACATGCVPRNERCVCLPGEGSRADMKSSPSNAKPDELYGELASLPAVGPERLKERWRILYGTEPPPQQPLQGPDLARGPGAAQPRTFEERT